MYIFISYFSTLLGLPNGLAADFFSQSPISIFLITLDGTWLAHLFLVVLSLESSSILASSTNHAVPPVLFSSALSYFFHSGSRCPHQHVLVITLAYVSPLTLRLLMSYIYIYIYGAPSKARNCNVVYIWTYVWQR